MNIKYLVLIMSSLVMLSSCNNSINLPFIGCEPPTTTPILSADTLLSYPEEIYINGNKFVTVATLENSPSDIKMFASVKNIDKFLFLPNDYKYEFIWIVQNGDALGKKNVWEIRDFYYTDNNKKETKWNRRLCIENTISLNNNLPIPETRILENIYVVVKISDRQGKEYFVRSKEGISLATVALY